MCSSPSPLACLFLYIRFSSSLQQKNKVIIYSRNKAVQIEMKIFPALYCFQNCQEIQPDDDAGADFPLLPL